jgi:hypothetical protein
MVLDCHVPYNYYNRNFFKISPTWQEALSVTKSAGISNNDIVQFYQITGVEKPNCL